MEPLRPKAGPTNASDAARLRALAYFLTFRTYGTWLHGDPRGSVDNLRNRFGTERLKQNWMWQNKEEALLAQPPMILTDDQRELCERTMRETCSYREWTLHALNVRTNHVPAVVSAAALPDRVMSDLKAFATRALRVHDLIGETRRVWAKHGSTRLIYTPDGVQRACVYTQAMQDGPKESHGR